MHHQWPKETVFRKLEMEIEDRSCPFCGSYMHLCDHRHRRLFTLEGPLHIVSKLAHCPDKICSGHHKTFSAESELMIAPGHWNIGWDLFAWIGHRRFSRHWSNLEIYQELVERYQIQLSEETVRRYANHYQTIVAAREQDLTRLVRKYEKIEDLVLSIDGLQPEKGHETLYAVREVNGRQIWFAQALLSSSHNEIRTVIEKAKKIAQAIGKPVKAWVSDKQDAFVSSIKEIFPGTAHRYCENHFLRGLAKPMLEADSHAKVEMRHKVRGLRAIEREIIEAQQKEISEKLQEQVHMQSADEQEEHKIEPCTETRVNNEEKEIYEEKAQDVVLQYCSAVRGVLNDSQGGPLHPPGLRMAESLTEIRQSLQRNVEVKKKGSHKSS